VVESVGRAAGATSAEARRRVPLQIGPRLRAQRERTGLSVRELARRVGLSASLISQIERDQVNPSVGTLYALVQELGLAIGELFTGDDSLARTSSPDVGASSGPLTTPDHRPVIHHASGGTLERLTPSGDPALDFIRLLYDVGSESCPEDSLVTHGGTEYGYVISGRLGVRIGFDAYEVAPGEAISFDSSWPHRLWAVGDEPVEAIWVVLGRTSDPRSRSSSWNASRVHHVGE
jgi:DNA-binding XRE family transcriptional regulator/mannose-6-phosphate isomerase-like protein (cupin superfamily)